MRARFLLNWLPNETSDAAGEIDITDRIIRPPHIISRVERDNWSWGITASGSLVLRIADPRGTFAPASETSSVFNYAGEDAAEIIVAYADDQRGEDYTNIWKGLVTAKGSSFSPASGTSKIYARAPDASLKDATTPTSVIARADDMPSLIHNIFQQQDILEIAGRLTIRVVDGVYIGDPVDKGVVIEDSTAISVDPLNAPTIAVVRTFLQMFDSVMAYVPSIDQTEIHPRGAGETLARPLRRILKIREENSGEEQIYNRIIIETGESGKGVIQVDSTASQEKYGLRTLQMNLAFLQSAAAARTIAENLIEKIARPRARLVVQINVWELGRPADIVLGRNVNVDIPAATEHGSLVHGGGFAPVGRYAEARHKAYKGVYWIEYIRWEPETDTATLQLRNIPGAAFPSNLYGEGPGAVSGEIAPGSITGAQIADGAITQAKIAAGAIGGDQIEDGTLTAAQIADGAITSAKLADGAITNAKIADGTITAAKFAAGVLPTSTQILSAPTQAFTANTWTATTVTMSGSDIWRVFYDDDVNQVSVTALLALTASTAATTIVDANAIIFGDLKLGRTSANLLLIGNTAGGTHNLRILAPGTA